MPIDETRIGDRVLLLKNEFNVLLANLQAAGYETIGPKVRDGSLVYLPITDLSDLPQGLTSRQDGGQYSLSPSGNDRYFDITPGAASWKQFLFPSRSELFQLSRENGSWHESYPDSLKRYAFIGVRACELAAIAIQDRVFLREDYRDSIYAARREGLFILAVNCLHPGDTCFCVSMDTGPEVTSGFDLKLTELPGAFLIEVGTAKGLDMLADLSLRPAKPSERQVEQAGLAEARENMGRELPDAADVHDLLMTNLDHPEWARVAANCLSCGSCTQVCPTCFCWDVEDSVSLDFQATSRTRVWDSCFNPSFSGVAGGNTRPETRARYRQWLTHKLASWVDQWGVIGCVGCGRCITWCPTGIDLTAEIRTIREAKAA